MENIRIDAQREAFEIQLNNLVSGETAAQMAVRAALAQQEAADERAYAENEHYEEISALADTMSIENFEDFDNYLTACFGMRLRDGIGELRSDPAAYYSSSKAIEAANKRSAVSTIRETSETVVCREKHIIHREWSPEKGFTKREETVSVPVSKHELKARIIISKLFPDTRNVSVKDRKAPVYSVVAVLMCMVVFIIPILLSVLNNEIAVQNKELDSQIRMVESEISTLESEVAIKRDISLIESLARDRYGMIDLELSQLQLVPSTPDSFTVSAPTEDGAPDVWVRLLNALAIIIGEN